MTVIALACMAGLLAFEAAANYYAGTRALHRQPVHFWVASASFFTGNALWMWALRNGAGMIRGSIVFAIGSVVGTALLGVLVFRETLTPSQVLGCVLGGVAIVLLQR